MEKDILTNRRFTRWFDQNNFPEKKVIKSLIEKTFELVPSKQNLMPYLITIFGPEHKKEKEEIIKLSTRKKMMADWGKNLNTQLAAPYLFIFSTRLITNPNKKIKDMIKRGIEFKACCKEKFNHSAVKVAASLEIGMFCMILTKLALEYKIDTAYTACHFNDPKGQTMIKNEVLFVMSLGYFDPTKSYKDFKDMKVKSGEVKPNIEDVIIWK